MSETKKTRNGPHRLKISVGSSRGKVNLREMSWRALMEKLTTPSVDASVTYAQYLKLPDDEQSDRKAAPGYMTGVVFANNVRRGANAQHRQLLSLDLDDVTRSQMDDLLMGIADLCDYEFFLHTTRKHCPEKPRWRIHIPLTRQVNASESGALSRILSTLILPDSQESIDIVDTVSHRFAQISYLPSISKDQEYRVQNNEGELADPDKILAAFDGDWTNYPSLPRKTGENSRDHGDLKKLGDPRDKPGAIGNFCRTYSVEDVIDKFLSETYSPGIDDENPRYNYEPGTSRNGAVVYDDGLYLYSNHGSDPINGGANAFDLLRAHKFGKLDKNSPDDTEVTKLPSYKAMVDFVHEDEECKKEAFENSPANKSWDFDDDDDDDGDDIASDPPAAPPKDKTPAKTAGDGEHQFDLDEDEEDDEPEQKPELTAKELAKAEAIAKLQELEKTPKGDAYMASFFNLKIICRYDGRLFGKLGYDEFLRRPVVLKQIKHGDTDTLTASVEKKDRMRGRAIQDDDLSQIRGLISAPVENRGYSLDFSVTNVKDCVFAAAKSQSFHPVRDMFKAAHKKYVESGRASQGAIETLPMRYLESEDNAFFRESSRMLMVALAARAFEPGCKFDCVTILQGHQGSRKSTFWRTLADDLFYELPPNFGNKAAMVEAMNGHLILEMGEMVGLRKETMEAAKEFITRQKDDVRLAYGTLVSEQPRQSILTGSTNKDEVLHDPTGNRRFWVWRVLNFENREIDIDALDREREMLWGEAYDEYLKEREAKPRGDLFLDLRSSEAKRIRDEINDEARAQTAVESMEDILEDWLDTSFPADELPDEAFGDLDAGEQPMVRNWVSLKQIAQEAERNPLLQRYRSADARTLARAARGIPGWEEVGRVKRNAKREHWFKRADNRLDDHWIPTSDGNEAETEADRLLS